MSLLRWPGDSPAVTKVGIIELIPVWCVRILRLGLIVLILLGIFLVIILSVFSFLIIFAASLTDV